MLLPSESHQGRSLKHYTLCDGEVWSAKTRSPGNNLFKIPHFSVKHLLDVRPPQLRET